MEGVLSIWRKGPSNDLEEGTQGCGIVGGFLEDIREYWGVRPQHSSIGRMPPKIDHSCAPPYLIDAPCNWLSSWLVSGLHSKWIQFHRGRPAMGIQEIFLGPFSRVCAFILGLSSLPYLPLV